MKIASAIGSCLLIISCGLWSYRATHRPEGFADNDDSSTADSVSGEIRLQTKPTVAKKNEADRLTDSRDSSVAPATVLARPTLTSSQTSGGEAVGSDGPLNADVLAVPENLRLTAKGWGAADNPGREWVESIPPEAFKKDW